MATLLAGRVHISSPSTTTARYNYLLVVSSYRLCGERSDEVHDHAGKTPRRSRGRRGKRALEDYASRAGQHPGRGVQGRAQALRHGPRHLGEHHDPGLGGPGGRHHPPGPQAGRDREGAPQRRHPDDQLRRAAAPPSSAASRSSSSWACPGTSFPPSPASSSRAAGRSRPRISRSSSPMWPLPRAPRKAGRS